MHSGARAAAPREEEEEEEEDDDDDDDDNDYDDNEGVEPHADAATGAFCGAPYGATKRCTGCADGKGRGWEDLRREEGAEEEERRRIKILLIN